MKKFDTVLSRFNELINEKREKISLLKDIVNGKYKEQGYHINWCKQELKIEQECLEDLIINFKSSYLEPIKMELKQMLKDYCDYKEDINGETI